MEHNSDDSKLKPDPPSNFGQELNSGATHPADAASQPGSLDLTLASSPLLPADSVEQDASNDATIISAKRNLSDSANESNKPAGIPSVARHASSVVAAAQVLLGKSLDHFELMELIGGGGMGAVFKARDTRLDRIVAVKVIPTAGQDPETARRFKFEAQSAAKLDHPHIARVYYVGEVAEWSYIVFEHVDGINLRDLVHSKGPLGLDEAVWFTRQVAEALAHASARFVVHRDIKPSNVLVTTKGIVKLVDMGLARTTAIERTSNDLTASNITLGTFDYISPEQARDPRSADVRSDLYSLGCTLYYLLSGKPPFPEGTAIQKLMMHGNVQPTDIRQHRIDVPDELAAILNRLMEKNPNKRYQNPVELINDLYLLAEFENLPRSRQAGTVAITPTIEDVTLLESLLPWMIVIGLLCGVTLWMQSVHNVKSAISLPREENPTTITSASLTESNNAIAGFNNNAAAGTVTPTGANVATSQQLSPTATLTNDNSEVVTQGDGSADDVSRSADTVSSPAARTPSEVGGGAATGTTLASSNSVVNGSSDSTKPNAVAESSVTNVLPTASARTFPWESPLPIYKPESYRSSPLLRVPAGGQAPGDQSGVLNQRMTSDTPTIVVDTTSPAIDDETLVVARSLEEALSICSARPQFNQIVLMQSVRITRKLSWEHPTLTIRSSSAQRVVIQIEPPTNSMPPFLNDSEQEQLYGFDVAQQSLRLIDIDLHVLSPESNEGIVSAFGLQPGSTIELEGCTATLKPWISGWRSCLFTTPSTRSGFDASKSKDRVDDSLVGNTSNMNGAERFVDPVQIMLRNCVVRGNGDFLIEPSATRTEVQWSNGLLAVDGRLIDYQGARQASRAPLNIRFELSQITVAAQRGFSRLTFDELSEYPVCLSVNASNCAYLIDADTAMFEFEGVNELVELRSTAMDLPQWTRWIDVRGTDNAYDANVRELIRLRRDGRITSRYDFETALRAILTERSPEAYIRWRQTPSNAGLAYSRAVSDFEQRAGAFVPGMQSTELPPLPASDAALLPRN